MTDDEAIALNRLAREQMKLRILADVSMDMHICIIEGWDAREYIRELVEMIGGLADGI